MKTRKEIYEFIKTNPDLKKEIKKVFNTDFTHVKTNALNTFLEGKKEQCCKGCDGDIDTPPLHIIVLRLITILRRKNLLLRSELNALVEPGENVLV